MSTQYQIKQNGFDEIKKKMILRTIPIALIAVGAGLAISHFRTNGQSSDVNTLPFTIPLILIAMTFGLIQGIKRQKVIFNSYKLIIDSEKVIRQQDMKPDIEIPIDAIKEITKNKNGILSIKGSKLNNSIEVPSQLENIEALEIQLSEISEIILRDKKTLMQKFPWFLPLLTIGLMMLVFISKNKVLVGLSGITLTSLLIYSFISTQRSKHVDKKTKRSMWLILIVLSSVIAVTYFKLFGMTN